MSSKIQLRRDTSSNWTATNPILAQGEPGLETNTNKVKYGDGTTAWNLLDYAAGGTAAAGDFTTGFEDGVDDKTYHLVRVQGKKEFDFRTEGYMKIDITITEAMLVDIGNGNLTFNATDTPEIADVWLTYTRGNNINFYMKSDYESGNYANWYNGLTNPDTGIYVTPAPVPFNVGDQIVCKYWSEGTTYTGSYYDNNGWYYPDTTSSGPSNEVTVRVDITPWLGDGSPGTTLYDLLDPALLSKHSLNFQSVSDYASDLRNITNIVNNNDGTLAFTFDGAPLQTNAITLTTFQFTAIDSQVDNWYLTIPNSIYPTFNVDAMNPYDAQYYTNNDIRSGTVTINGGPEIVFNWFGNRDGNNGNFWINNRDSAWTYNQGDTIVVNFYKHSTLITINTYRPDNAQNNWNNGYKWFDWKEDIATEYSPGRGNGIAGGQGQLYMTGFKAPSPSGDTGGNTSLVSQFGWAGLGNYQRSPYDPYTQDYADNKGAWGCYPMNNFDDRGIVFYNNSTDNDWSQSWKIRIVYRFDLIIGAEDYGWFNC